MRITSSRFREVCHVRGETSADHLAERMFKGSGMQTMEMKRALAMEPVAVQEYCTLKNVNFFLCGFVVHPDTPWLGSSPDGIIFDPSVRPQFGLLEVKCPNVPSYVDCPYLKIQNGELKLNRSHAYYWQVQGQILLTGCRWLCHLCTGGHPSWKDIYRSTGFKNYERRLTSFIFTTTCRSVYFAPEWMPCTSAEFSGFMKNKYWCSCEEIYSRIDL